MASPVWITESGSLGVVPEGKFYRISLQANDPDFPTDPTKVTYSLIAGALPEGVEVNTSGTIEGIPISVAVTQGVPSEVSADTTSKFAIRVTSVDDETLIVDRTFTLTVSGQDKPVWVTPAGNIGTWAEGTEVDFQFEAYDLDPGDELTITRVTGTFPDGVTLTPDGLLTGFITPLVPPTFDQNHEFTLRLSDGKDVVLRTFDLDASSQAVRPPYITNNVPDLGRFRHDNYFAHKFDGQDPDGDEIRYELVTSDLPGLDVSDTSITADSDTLTVDIAGMSLDTETGWLHGYLPDIGLTEVTYTFSLDVYKLIDDTVRSSVYATSMTLFGNIDLEVIWTTDADVGVINNGGISIFTIEAEHATFDLEYRLAEGGVCSKLPQGLKLLPSGNIVGQVSFKTFSLDGGTTTFDEAHATRLDTNPTTFDLTYTFTVDAYNEVEGISVLKEFTILVNKEYDVPHSPIYCKAMPPLSDRELLDTLLLNTTVLPADALYRADDPNFGVAEHIIYNHAYGLSPSTASDYLRATELNHYNKNLVLGEIKTARALDADENIIYEVVYSQVVDTLVNANGESVSSSVDLTYPAIDDGLSVTTVYPNSLANMGAQVIDEIGQSSKVLPTWMLSKQEDGTVPGFTAAWVIAYTDPGKSKLIQYNIEEFFGTQLNLIDFEIDRYTLDAGLLEHWDKITADQLDVKADRDLDTADSTLITVDNSISSSVPTTADSSISINDPGNWSQAAETTFDRTAIETPDGPETLLDGGCTQFISPIDIYDAGDSKDKYIKFPKTQIINNEQ